MPLIYSNVFVDPDFVRVDYLNTPNKSANKTRRHIAHVQVP